MTIAEALSSLAGDIPRIDMELLLSHVIRQNRSWLITHGNDCLDDHSLRQWNYLADRRAKGEPLAYIIGEKEFFGRTFIVNADVLVPRPATEGLVEASMQFFKKQQPVLRDIDSGIVALGIPLHQRKKGQRELQPFTVKNTQQPMVIIDIGTGSGAIAISLSFICDVMKIIATDASIAALEIAKENARRLTPGCSIEYMHETAMESIQRMNEPFIIVSNPPYIPLGSTDVALDVSTFEPSVALFADADGLGVIRQIIIAARGNPQCRGFIIECRKDQAETIRALCTE